MLSLSDCVEANLDRAAGDVIDGEAIIINLATGAYYSMRGIGGDVWAMIAERRSVGSMVDQITATYEVSPEVAHRDLDAVLGQLMSEGLIQLAADGGRAGAVPAGETKKPYAQPLLEVYRDMEDLLALDPPAPGMNQIPWGDRGSK